MDTLLSPNGNGSRTAPTPRFSAEAVAPPTTSTGPLGRRPARRARMQRLAPARSREVPILALLAYYAALVAAAVVLGWVFPTLRESMVSLEASGYGTALDGWFSMPSPPAESRFVPLLHRGISTLVVTAGALLLVVPVAWIYMRTKRLRYDPSLVQSVIVLPIVVTGILMVAKHSIAIAFGVVGIVAAVRFRNNLADPKDAVYIFLALAIGVAAGVQALDVALVTSFTFNVLILILWRYNVGSIYGGAYGRTGIVSIGDRHLMLARTRRERRQLELDVRKKARKTRADGLLLVHTAEAMPGRGGVEELLDQRARRWKLARFMARPDGFSTLEYVLRLKRKTDPVELVTDLDDHGSVQIAAVEYVPLGS